MYLVFCKKYNMWNENFSKFQALAKWFSLLEHCLPVIVFDFEPCFTSYHAYFVSHLLYPI